MARPREFDEDEVIKSAMEAFWHRGYEGTSVRDLMEATGLAKGSVYKAFGDKETLFRAALKRYLADGESRFTQLLEAHSAEDALEAWFENIVRSASRRNGPIGCFVVNTCIELAPHDTEIRTLLRAHVRRVEGLYERALQKGIDEGSFCSDLDVPRMARMIQTLMFGMQSRARAGLSRAEAQNLVQHAFELLR